MRSAMVPGVLVGVLTVACSSGGPGVTTPETPPPSQNRAPSATIAAVSPAGQALAAATVVTFTGSGSDPDGDALTLSWSFGDGTTGTGPSVSHVFNTAGSWTVTLTVSDGRGGSGTASTSVTSRAMTGVWTGSSEGVSLSVSFTQDGASLTGRVTIFGGTVTWPGRVSDPRSFAISGVGDGCPTTMRGALNDTLTAINGTFEDGPPCSGVHAYTATRP